MKYIILFLCILGTAVTQAQNDKAYVEGLIQEFTQKLNDRGIHDYFIAQHYCSGKIEMFQIDGKMCVTKDTYVETYVLWKEDEQSFLKKIDNCGLFHSVTLADDALYDYYLSNREAIKTETVKKYRSENYDGKPASSRKVQPCFRSYALGAKGEGAQGTYNLFDVSNTSEEGANTNYSFNSNLKVVQLNELLADEVKKHTFKRF